MFTIYKKRGQTPLQALHQLRNDKPEYKNSILSYAGRLDPMAEGVMLVLEGEEENKQRAKYLGIDKEYEVDILFGMETDTHDVLGLITDTDIHKNVELNNLEKIIKTFQTTFLQDYPAYSSKPVGHKPLFQHARDNTLDSIEIPKKSVTIYSIELLKMCEINSHNLLQNILLDIDLVSGDFRQEEIKKNWIKNLENIQTNFIIISLKVSCSSSTYMRSLAHMIGKKLGTGAIAYRIVRIKVGKY